VNRNPHTITAAAGFTLLELLVVLVIIGIVSSFAVLSTGLTGRNKPLDKESQRLLALMQMASEESVQKTEELGLTVGNDGYHFLRYDYDQNTWQPLEDDLYRERSLPDDLTLNLILEGRPIVLEDPSQTDSSMELDKDTKSKTTPPQILFLSSGEVSSFSLTLHEHPGSAERVIKSVGDGSFTVGDGTEPVK
jgi:general secretion pathway protein H